MYANDLATIMESEALHLAVITNLQGESQRTGLLFHEQAAEFLRTYRVNANEKVPQRIVDLYNKYVRFLPAELHKYIPQNVPSGSLPPLEILTDDSGHAM